MVLIVDIKYKLFKAHCMALYGRVLRDLYSSFIYEFFGATTAGKLYELPL